MGCGSRGDLFRILEYGLHTNRGCSTPTNNYSTSNKDTNLELLNKMFVSDVISEEEYGRYKRLVINGSMSFDELVRLQHQRKKQSGISISETKKISKESNKIERLRNSRDQILKVIKNIDNHISDLEKQKHKVKLLLDEYIKHNEKKAEEYISKKIDIEESIQNLKRKQSSLNDDLDDMTQQIKMMEVQELEQEAKKLHDEFTKIKNT